MNGSKMNEDSQPHLDQSLRDYYAAQSLPESTFNQLMACRTGETPVAADTGLTQPGLTTWCRKLKNSLFLTRLTALTSLALLSGLGLGLLFHAFHWQTNSADLVFAEIAMNHNKQLAMEYQSDDYQQLSALMTRLEFPLNQPPSLGGQHQLVGGRYCSIQGQLAAQLRLTQPDTLATETLYVTPLNEKLRSIDTGLRTQDGVSVETWRDERLFYALAK